MSKKQFPEHWDRSLSEGGAVLINGEAITDRARLEKIHAGQDTAGAVVANNQVEAEGDKQPTGATPKGGSASNATDTNAATGLKVNMVKRETLDALTAAGFDSIDAIKGASDEQLRAVEGVDDRVLGLLRKAGE